MTTAPESIIGGAIQKSDTEYRVYLQTFFILLLYCIVAYPFSQMANC